MGRLIYIDKNNKWNTVPVKKIAIVSGILAGLAAFISKKIYDKNNKIHYR